MAGSAEPAYCIISRPYRILSHIMTASTVRKIGMHGGSCPIIFIMAASILILPFVDCIFEAFHLIQESITVIDISSGVALAIYILMVGARQVLYPACAGR